VLIEDTGLDVFLVRESILVHNIPAELHAIEDGELAMEYLKKVEAGQAPVPQLFLLDLNLPRRDGHEVLAEIRQSSRCASVPVVIMTSSDSAEDHARTAALGASSYFRKPPGYAAFLKLGELIRELLGLESSAS
jgi:two-component system, chemotaxis family, response regulator Rcp1